MCIRDGLFSAESGKWTRFWVMFDVSSFRITSRFSTVALLLFSLLFAYISHHICLVLAATPPHYHFLPISLNSLDLAGFEIAESSWLTRYYQQLQVPMLPVQVMQPSSDGSSTKILVIAMFRFMLINNGPSWDDRGSSSWVIFFSFGFVHSRTMCVL